MPVRFSQGANSLRTATNTLLHGSGTASLSVWLRINAVNATTNTINLWTKQFNSVFQVIRPNTQTSRITIQWLGVNGNPGGSSTLTVTVAYHLAMTWVGGTQVFWVNGTQVATGTFAGALTNPGAARYLQLGAGNAAQTDLDFTLDDPALWDGYALTAADVVALRDRTSDPTTITPASLVWFAGLEGTAGVSCVAGDAGLVNQGTAGTGQNLATVSSPAPIYDGTPLVYSPPTVIKTAAVAPSGKLAGWVFQDLTNAPANLTAINNAPTVRLNGGSPQALSGPVWGSAGPAQPWLLYPLPFTAGPGDVVTFSAPLGWLTSAAGTIAASTDAPPTNKVNGSLLPTFTPGGKAMGAGYNLQRLRYYLPVPCYANVFKLAGAWAANFGSFTLDADGYLATMTGTCYAIVSLCDVGGVPGYPALPAGVWTLKDDGNGTAALGVVGAYAGQASVALLTNNFTGTTDNTSTYNVTRVSGAYFPAVQLNVTALGTTGVKNIRVYPPGV